VGEGLDFVARQRTSCFRFWQSQVMRTLAWQGLSSLHAADVLAGRRFVRIWGEGGLTVWAVAGLETEMATACCCLHLTAWVGTCTAVCIFAFAWAMAWFLAEVKTRASS
jgi:hypothetical protein